ncbi:BQ5605_C019g08999 [Microbotryum silenes-dioicae]|uniref:BQ5605_C019g08999 protein n=1 Tax=Microbotryum silenes-dioicae TaxID=796604 RepID=A0A2X0MI32_9BASI|nr:BQ5605_C019g08999 [Microbotryum silenes-dioicae]
MPNPAAWNAVLEQYARLHNPERELPKGVHLLSDSKCVTIFDGYEKAKYHFLVMPRYPFPLESSSSPSSASTSTSISVPSSHLTSLEALRKSPYCLRVLHALQEQARQVQEMIEEEMLKKEGWKWPIHIGFHARESMRHVHLHVISSDLISPKLKNKNFVILRNPLTPSSNSRARHYNSFHPSLGFFLHLTKVIEQVEASQKDTNSTSSYENLLKVPLRSHYTGQQYPTIPKLKVHLEEEWERRGKEEKRRQALPNKDGIKAPSDSERDRGADLVQGRAKKVKVDRTEEDVGASSGDETI